MKIKKLNNSKLFFNKYPYKIACKVKSRIEIYAKLAGRLTANKDIRLRAEGKSLNIFCQNYDTTLEIYNVVKSDVDGVFGPSSVKEEQYLINGNSYKVTCDSLPRGEYKYRIFFKHMKVESRDRFYKWLQTQSKDQYHLGGMSALWMQNHYRFKQDPFMYVKDSSLVTMITLFLGEDIKKTQEFVIRNKVLSE